MVEGDVGSSDLPAAADRGKSGLKKAKTAIILSLFVIVLGGGWWGTRRPPLRSYAFLEGQTPLRVTFPDTTLYGSSPSGRVSAHSRHFQVIEYRFEANMEDLASRINSEMHACGGRPIQRKGPILVYGLGRVEDDIALWQIPMGDSVTLSAGPGKLSKEGRQTVIVRRVIELSETPVEKAWKWVYGLF